MIYLNNYCTDFMFFVVMVCIIFSSTIFSLKIFNNPLVFKMSLCVHVLILKFIHIISFILSFMMLSSKGCILSIIINLSIFLYYRKV